MAVVRCKMCGGDLVIEPGSTIAECEFCGSRQTVPTGDDEKKLQQFERAEWLRRSCEFDKAAGVYETIVSEYRQESEAYWGLVLCKYGIEYVDDPATGKKIPTCHRSSYESVMDDPNLEQALDYADVVARRQYREEAKQIEELRKSILAVSSNEQPYDIFICYKETDAEGNRTVDSVMAQDLYTALTEKGYRVFFSRVTLREKLGEEFEPYIFAALNSAKVMLAIGTDYEYFNAVWVKNEWSRYLKICSADKSKHLIPCYKGIDAYDMPREFKPLQAVDLGQMGAVQDILFNMEKYIPLKKETAAQEATVYAAPADNRQGVQLDRGYMALEDGEWKKADTFFEEALNLDAHSARAYIGKALAQAQCRNLHALLEKRLEACQDVQAQSKSIEPEKAQAAHIDESVQKYTVPGYLPADKVKAFYAFNLSYSTDVPGREAQMEAQKQWWQTHKLLSRAEQFAKGDAAGELQSEKKFFFDALTERIKDAEKAEAESLEALRRSYAQFLSEADAKAEEECRSWSKKREEYYQEWCAKAESESSEYSLNKLAVSFDRLGDYRDSKAMAALCRKRIEEKAAKEQEVREQQSRLHEQEQKKTAHRKKVVLIVSVSLLLLAIAAYFIVKMAIIYPKRYEQAQEYLRTGDYDAGYAIMEALGKHDEVAENKYERAVEFFADGKYAEVISLLENQSDYKDSADYLSKSRTLLENKVLTHAEYIAAELGSKVCIETYVQAHQAWWDGKITVYAQSEDGAYFIYNMTCAEEDADKLVPGTKILVKGAKDEWRGEMEIIDATFEIEEGSFIAEPVDVTDLLGKEELIDHQNELVCVKGLTVERVQYKNYELGDDIYLTFRLGELTVEFCVKALLTGPDSELYAAVGALNVGDVVDVEGFLNWYNGANAHLTKVTHQ